MRDFPDVSTPQPQEIGPRVGLTVLLAEDDANLRAMLAIVLRRDGHRVREFRNGGELREQLEAVFRPEQAAPENLLVISDLRMPEADGLTLMRAVCARGHRPPFILLTAFGSPEVHAAAKALGAIRVLDKPFDFDELRGVVRRFGDERPPC
jgi:two-component system, response regulator, stage 0 sporulation protein F